MFLSTRNIIMNKVISHFHYIYIASPLLKKKLGYKPFTINIYFNSSQYYPTLDKTLAKKLSFYLICFIIRIYIIAGIYDIIFRYLYFVKQKEASWSFNFMFGYKDDVLSFNFVDRRESILNIIQNLFFKNINLCISG
jgi:hypothetical protein